MITGEIKARLWNFEFQWVVVDLCPSLNRSPCHPSPSLMCFLHPIFQWKRTWIHGFWGVSCPDHWAQPLRIQRGEKKSMVAVMVGFIHCQQPRKAKGGWHLSMKQLEGGPLSAQQVAKRWNAHNYPAICYVSVEEQWLPYFELYTPATTPLIWRLWGMAHIKTLFDGGQHYCASFQI